MGEMKSGKPMDELLKSSPIEFSQYFAHSRSLGFEDAPDYDLLRRIFRQRMEQEGWQYDDQLDWLNGDRAGGTLLPGEYQFDQSFICAPKLGMDLRSNYIFT
jgi:hypothetical protein